MASSEDETKPSGSSLNLFKYNVRATIKNTKKRSYSSQTSSSSLSYKRRIRNDNTSDVTTTTTTSGGCSSSQGATNSNNNNNNNNNTGASNSNNKRKKRTRKEVLASISANAKKLTIPIPSFKMKIINDKKNDGNSRLSQLERAYFDEESDDSNTSDDSCLFDDELNKRHRITNNNSNNTDKKLAASKDNDNSIKNDMVSSSRKVEDIPKVILSVIVEVDDNDDDETETDDSDDEIPSLSIVQKGRRNDESKPSSTVLQTAVVHKQSRNKNKEKSDRTICLNVSSLSVSGESTDKLQGADIDDNKKNEPKGDNNDKEEEVESDNDCVDFQDGDGDDNVNGDEKVAKLSSTNMNETEDREVLVPLGFDLDREIDLLFVNSDSNTITVNIFYRELEIQIGKSLDKVNRKKVKSRLVSLINGRVKPIADTRTITPTMTKDITMKDKENGSDVVCSKKNVGENGDNEAKLSMEIQGIDETSCHTTVVDEKSGSNKSHFGEAEIEISSDCQIIVVDENSSSNRPQHEVTKKGTRCQTKGVDEKSDSDKSHNEKVGKGMSFRMDVVDEKKSSSDKSQKGKVEDEAATTSASHKSASQKKKGKLDRSQVTQKTKKPPTTKKITQKLNAKIQTEGQTNPESGDNKESNPKTSKGSKSRKSKPKVSDKDSHPTNGTTSASVAATAPSNRPRKRARSKLCAFCKTCSCQKADSNDIIPVLDMNKFSRTNAAKEKALIRRLQNLEMKTENLEEQTEVARRQLKKHRRDLWKRKERDISNTTTMVGVAPIDDYFLPDTEIFEKQQMESQALPEGLWEKAQIKVFPKAPSEYMCFYSCHGWMELFFVHNRHIFVPFFLFSNLLIFL